MWNTTLGFGESLGKFDLLGAVRYVFSQANEGARVVQRRKLFVFKPPSYLILIVTNYVRPRISVRRARNYNKYIPPAEEEEIEWKKGP